MAPHPDAEHPKRPAARQYDVRAAAAALIERTCREQGKPHHVEDPGALARLAALMGPTVPAARPAPAQFC